MAAAFLWRTQVPDDLHLPRVDPAASMTVAELHHRERHDRVPRWLGVATLVAELGALLVYARRPPRVRGREVVRAAQLGALGAAVLFLSALPFSLATLWWQRRSGIARVGYAQWLLDRAPGVVEEAAVLALAAAVGVAVAARLGARWWVVAAPAFALVGVGVILAQPLLTPRLDPLRRPALVGEIRRLAAIQGIGPVDVQVQRMRNRTRQVNAEALGIGPTKRVILWDTTLRLRRDEIRFLVAHELGHVSRAHLWKGLGWFVLIVVPATFLLARLVPLRSSRDVPSALLAGVAILLVVTPFANAISRRYEAEADWVALETTRDPGGARRFFVDLSAVGLRDPSPPSWATLLFGTHPSLADRLAMTKAWATSRLSAGSSPEGS